MKKSELIEVLNGMPDVEVGIGYWDTSWQVLGATYKEDENGLKPFIHITLGGELPQSQTVPLEETPSVTYGTGATLYKEDPNGNRIKAIALTKNDTVIAFMRLKDCGELLTAERCESRNTRFKYWKHINDVDVLKAAKAYLGQPVYGLDEAEEMTMPLFFIED